MLLTIKTRKKQQNLSFMNKITLGKAGKEEEYVSMN